VGKEYQEGVDEERLEMSRLGEKSHLIPGNVSAYETRHDRDKDGQEQARQANVWMCL
jgi:hypothetical protein